MKRLVQWLGQPLPLLIDRGLMILRAVAQLVAFTTIAEGPWVWAVERLSTLGLALPPGVRAPLGITAAVVMGVLLLRELAADELRPKPRTQDIPEADQSFVLIWFGAAAMIAIGVSLYFQLPFYAGVLIVALLSAPAFLPPFRARVLDALFGKRPAEPGPDR